MWLTLRETLQIIAEAQVQLLQIGQLPEAFGHQISKIRNKGIKDATTCLTLRKGFDSRVRKVKLLQVDQKPEAFGHQNIKNKNKMSKNDATHSLGGT